jgi:hypothetical protein
MSGGDRSLLALDEVKTYVSKIKTCKKKGRDSTSLSSLVNHDISQSAAIRLGNVLEEIFNIAISKFLTEKFVRSNLKKNEKGERQKDVLMINDDTKHVIYAEIKANINLDTQKAPATVKSTIDVVKAFETKGYTVDGYVIALRYLSTKDVPAVLAKKYALFTSHENIELIGIRDFLVKIMDEPISELSSYEKYSEFLTTLAKSLEECNSE